MEGSEDNSNIITTVVSQCDDTVDANSSSNCNNNNSNIESQEEGVSSVAEEEAECPQAVQQLLGVQATAAVEEEHIGSPSVNTAVVGGDGDDDGSIRKARGLGREEMHKELALTNSTGTTATPPPSGIPSTLGRNGAFAVGGPPSDLAQNRALSNTNSTNSRRTMGTANWEDVVAHASFPVARRVPLHEDLPIAEEFSGSGDVETGGDIIREAVEISSPRSFCCRSSEDHCKNHRVRGALACLLGSGLGILVVGLVLVLALVFKKDDASSSAPSGAPIPNITVAIASRDLLGPIPDSTVVSLNDRSTPQAKAYEWVLGDPYLDSYSKERIRQRFALVTLYYALNGDQWESNTHWLNYNRSECQWAMKKGEADANSGLSSCDADDGKERLQLILLIKNDLNGSIPEEVGLLSHLTHLNLGANRLLSGTIPSQLAMLVNLETLDLQGPGAQSVGREFVTEGLSGFLPSEIGLLTKLTGMGTPYNYLIKGTIPTEYGALTMLKGLYLLDTSLTSTIPTEFGRLTNIVDLRLEDNCLSGSVPTELGELTALKQFHVEFNGRCRENSKGLSGSLPTELARLTDLLQLGLASNSFTHIPSGIWKLSKLMLLTAEHNLLTGTISSEIGFMSALRYATVYSNFLSGTLPTEIGMMTSLEEAWIHDNELSGVIPSEVALLSNLQVLALDGNELRGFPPELVSKEWKYLRLGPGNATGECIETIAQSGEVCGAFILSGCSCNRGKPQLIPLAV